MSAGAVGWRYIVPKRGPVTLIESFQRWDGSWYDSIVNHGYSYDASKKSNVAFFPAYPVLGAGLAALTGCGVDWSMVIVSQVCLALGFVIFHRYLALRWAQADPLFAATALLLLAVFPPTFFFRFAYSEGLFFCLVAAALLAVECRSSLVVLALIVGFATGVRPVGVGLVPIVIREIWRRSSTWSGFLGRCSLLLPLSLWGLIAFSIYLYIQFDDPLLFAKAQRAWDGHAHSTLIGKIVGLLTLKPIWGAFLPWSGHAIGSDIDLLPQTWGGSASNAVFFIWAVFLIIIGWRRGWLSWTERLAALGLLGIPYVTRAFESNFLSFARFSAVALPIYVPMALVFLRWSRMMQWTYLLLCVWLLILASALFAAGFELT